MNINKEFLNNKVNPENQTSFPFLIFGDEKELSFKIMFIGNSITLHERKDDIGWYKECGMAASDINHDYVHLVYKALKEKYPLVNACVLNGGFWEKDYLNESKLKTIIDVVEDYKPDLLVIRIGENFNKEMLVDKESPYIAFNSLISESKKHSKRIIVSSMFWAHPVIDMAIKKASQNNNVEYVFLSDIGENRKYAAYDQYKNNAIYCGHPGDLGMQVIADRFLQTIFKDK